jgi:outer membrane protein assembly factor BamB
MFRLATFLALGMMGLAPAARGIDWIRWRGPDLNGVSRETGWSSQWPPDGPKQLWEASVGVGFSSVTVSQGRAYTMGNADGQDTVFCFNAETGAVNWKGSYPCGLRPQYYEGGTSSTPTVDGDRVYTLGKEGQLFCLQAADGKILWQKNLTNDPGATLPRWAFAGSPLVQAELLILNAGPAGTAVDKLTGKTVWFSGKGAAGYATPVPITIDGRPCVLIFSSKALVCVAVRDGQELWRYPWVTHWDLNIADPVVSGDRVFLSTFDQGSVLLKVDGQRAKEVWRNRNLSNHFSSSVLFDGFLYGVDGNTDKPPADFRCLDFQTGAIRWKQPGLGFGALMIADGKLLIISERGELVLAKATPDRFEELARAQVLGGKCWITPVLSNGRIYCRNAQGHLVCLDVRQ